MSQPPEEQNKKEEGEGAPKQNKDEKELVDSLFGKARDPAKQPKNSNNKKESSSGELDESSSNKFTGPGRRLGHVPESVSPVVEEGRPTKVRLHITFYKNGFTLEKNGALIPSESQEGKAILQALDKGFIPSFISKKYPKNAEFDVALEKRDTEVYVKPFEAFDGQGRGLGGMTSSSSGGGGFNNSSGSGSDDQAAQIRAARLARMAAKK